LKWSTVPCGFEVRAGVIIPPALGELREGRDGDPVLFLGDEFSFPVQTVTEFPGCRSGSLPGGMAAEPRSIFIISSVIKNHDTGSQPSFIKAERLSVPHDVSFSGIKATRPVTPQMKRIAPIHKGTLILYQVRNNTMLSYGRGIKSHGFA
jgi:hypothetical protein